MITLLLVVGFFAIAMAGMATGVILSNRRLHGSCGGPGGDDCLCEIEKRRACHARKQFELSGLAEGPGRVGLFGGSSAGASTPDGADGRA